MVPYVQGFGVGAGLIIAIGAQNAFVLSQGIKRQYQWLVPLICSMCDCILILAGAAGIGTLIASNPSLARISGWGGALFLFVYGIRSFISAFKTGSLEEGGSPARETFKSVVLTTLALTLLNPHVYLDTIILLGSISGQHPGMGKYAFSMGACTASIIWFFSLSFAGSLLRPVFRNPVFWKILDFFVGATMWIIACSILPKA